MQPRPPLTPALRLRAGLPASAGARDAVPRWLLRTPGDAALAEEPASAAAPEDAPAAAAPMAACAPDPMPSPSTLCTRWRSLAAELARVLAAMPAPDAPAALDAAAHELVALVELAPALAIFLTVRPDTDEHAHYGVERSLQAATTAVLVARRANWPAERCLALAKAAFTMNLGMLELQHRLSNQARLPGPAQRQAVLDHPAKSVQILRDSGIADPAWLQAVAEHHEVPGGGGYPAGRTTVCEMAQVLRTADIYTAKLAGRSGRDALTPERALRELLRDERANPHAHAIAAEFGPHPPGTTVRLHTGEIAVVIASGAAAVPGVPRVAVVTTARAQSLAEPVARDATGRTQGIAAQIDPRTVALGAERLLAATGR